MLTEASAGDATGDAMEICSSYPKDLLLSICEFLSKKYAHSEFYSKYT